MTTITTTAPVQQTAERKTHPIRRATIICGVLAAAATSVFAAIASAAGVPFKIDGESIPVSGFATLTLLGAVLGAVLLLVTNSYAARPRRRFLQITVALAALSCIPSLLSPPDTASKIALVFSHMIAAAIIVPVLARNAAQR